MSADAPAGTGTGTAAGASGERLSGGEADLPADWRLLKAEVAASIAFAGALVEPGILSPAERDSIVTALRRIEDEAARGALRPAAGDVFAAVEARLTELAGPVAGRLIAGRGRGEQMLTALRLWLLDEMDGIGELIATVQRALLQQAEAHVGTLMPGYTDFQPVQVVSCAHWLLSYFWMLARDQERLLAAIGRASASPLGSGALAGAPYRIDRRALAAAMGFREIVVNSVDAVGDLDFAAEFLFVAAMTGLHMSRLAEDLIRYSNPALGFVTLDAQYATGSALASLRHGPNAVALARGQAGRLLGELAGFLGTLKGLAAAFHQDMQENQRALFGAVDTLKAILTTMEGVILTLTVHPDRMLAALDERILASDLADYLAERGTPYRAAHQIVERLIGRAETGGKPISALPLSVFQAESPAFDADVFAVFDYSRSAAQRASAGGTAPAAIRAQIRQALDWLTEAGLE